MDQAFPVRHFGALDSTNAEAQRLVEGGEQGPLWVVAGEQLAGRGRLGRTWISKPGSLYATLILPHRASVGVLPQLSFVAALAIHQAASEATGSGSISLKWPNDCLLDGAKFSGILIESLKSGLVALGMGINISHAPEGLAYRASFLAAHGCVETPLQIQARLDQALRHWLGVWNSGAGFTDIRVAWKAACSHMGKPVSVNLPEGRVEGVFSGLAEDGAMLLKVDGATRVIHAGDVAAL